MAAPARIRYTYEDWLAIPEDRSRLYEIVDGELFVSPPPVFRHQQVAASISRVLLNLALEHALGEVVQSPIGVRLGDDTVVEPDVLFVAAERRHIIDPDGAIWGPPDLVVEILSPSNRAHDRTRKRTRYLAAGVPEVWIVDAHERTVEVWRPRATEPERPQNAIEWRVGDRTFEIPLADIFRE
jgi:Uma2 family endonuclease